LRHESPVRPKLYRALLGENSEKAHADISRNAEQARRLIWRQGKARHVPYLATESIEECVPHLGITALVGLDV
jgi:hypothetical protein